MLKKISHKKDDFIILVDTRLKKETLREINNTWKGYNYGAVNETPHGSGGILILARKGMDMIPLTMR